MKKINKRLITTTLIILALISFYKINNLNYIKHIDIKNSFVEHPENLPTKEAALNSSFWYKNLKADIYRLKAIQYIGWNAIWSEYKKYLYFMTDLITELNPYFVHPYVIAQLLLPNYNERYENLTEEEQEKHVNEAEEIWLKWIKNFCDMEKIDLIDKEDNLQKIWTDDKFTNPCSEYSIPNYLAYVYYYYKNDPKSAAKYYKVASAVKDWLEWSRIMAAIMAGKWWNREKSFFMFLNIAKYIESNDEVCLEYASNLEKVWAMVFINKQTALDWKLIKDIEVSRDKVFWKFSEEKEWDVISDTSCLNYVNKSIRELNLGYIERANDKFEKDKKRESISAQELYEEKYIDYLPIDFQQYKDYWIIYYYNKDIKNYDYKMGTYEELGL